MKHWHYQLNEHNNETNFCYIKDIAAAPPRGDMVAFWLISRKDLMKKFYFPLYFL